jgi:hypothetical protein
MPFSLLQIIFIQIIITRFKRFSQQKQNSINHEPVTPEGRGCLMELDTSVHAVMQLNTKHLVSLS